MYESQYWKRSEGLVNIIFIMMWRDGDRYLVRVQSHKNIYNDNDQRTWKTEETYPFPFKDLANANIRAFTSGLIADGFALVK